MQKEANCCKLIGNIALWSHMSRISKSICTAFEALVDKYLDGNVIMQIIFCDMVRLELVLLVNILYEF